MEEILSALTALIFRRLVLSTVAAMALAAVVSSVIPAFTAGYCLALVILGVALGIYWESLADAGTTTAREDAPATSRPVTFLGLAFIGFFCGGVLVEILGSIFWGTVAVVAGAALIALWFRQAIRRDALAFALCSLLMGYSIVLLLHAWAS